MYAQHSFAVYALATQARGARAIVAPAKNLGHDLDAMASAIASDTALDLHRESKQSDRNPSSSGSTSRRFSRGVPARVVVVIDEAYNEYLPPERRFDSALWVRKFPNLLIARTFSKAYGLAGLRVGYGIAQTELTDLLNRVRQPFNVNAVGPGRRSSRIERC